MQWTDAAEFIDAFAARFWRIRAQNFGGQGPFRGLQFLVDPDISIPNITGESVPVFEDVVTVITAGGGHAVRVERTGVDRSVRGVKDAIVLNKSDQDKYGAINLPVLFPQFFFDFFTKTGGVDPLARAEGAGAGPRRRPRDVIKEDWAEYMNKGLQPAGETARLYKAVHERLFLYMSPPPPAANLK